METFNHLRDRPYVEAYPRIDIGAARAAAGRGRRAIEWRNQLGRSVGGAIVDFTAPDHMVARIVIGATRVFDEFREHLEIDIQYVPAGKFRERPQAVCRGCNKNKSIIALKRDIWLCMACQDLVNRSSLLSYECRITEAIEALDIEIGAGRSPNKHQSSLDRAIAERKRLIAKLPRGRISASTNFMDFITSEWYAVSGYSTHVMGDMTGV
jgi:ribosomal protein L37AE/L43A